MSDPVIELQFNKVKEIAEKYGLRTLYEQHIDGELRSTLAIDMTGLMIVAQHFFNEGRLTELRTFSKQLDKLADTLSGENK